MAMEPFKPEQTAWYGCGTQRELVVEQVSAMEAKGKAAKVPPAAAAAASGALLQKNRLTKVLKLELIRARLPEGRWVVSGQCTAEERSRLAREARRALEQMKAAREL